MPSGDRHHIASIAGVIALGALALVGPLIVRTDRERQTYGQAADEEQSKARPEAPSGRAEISNEPPANVSPDKAEPEQRQHPNENAMFGDRQAQGLMVIAAFLGVLVSVITIYLIGRTVRLQVKATGHALRAAEAGWASARLIKSQMIAYVHAPAARLSQHTQSRSALAGGDPRLELQVANVGQTPATNVRVDFEIRSERVSEIVGWKPFGANKIRRELSNIAPNQAPWFELMSTVLTHLALMERHGEHFVLRGEVLYDDVLANGYRSRFVYFFIVLPGRPFGPLGPIPLVGSTFDLMWPAEEGVDEEALAAHNRAT